MPITAEKPDALDMRERCRRAIDLAKGYREQAKAARNVAMRAELRLMYLEEARQ